MEFVLQDELTALSNNDFTFPSLPLDEMDQSDINAALNGQSKSPTYKS
jgi:hypothetical protein